MLRVYFLSSLYVYFDRPFNYHPIAIEKWSKATFNENRHREITAFVVTHSRLVFQSRALFFFFERALQGSLVPVHVCQPWPGAHTKNGGWFGSRDRGKKPGHASLPKNVAEATRRYHPLTDADKQEKIARFAGYRDDREARCIIVANENTPSTVHGDLPVRFAARCVWKDGER